MPSSHTLQVTTVRAITAVSVALLSAARADGAFIDVPGNLPQYNVPSAFSIEIPKFSPSNGPLQAIHILHGSQFLYQASSTAVGETFVNPNYIAAWNWSGTFRFRFAGTGFESDAASFQSISGTVRQPDPAISVTTGVSAVMSAFSSEFVILPSSPFFNSYIGPTGTVPATFSAAFLTETFAGPDGFYWSDATEFLSSTSAVAQSSLLIRYEYAVPEPSAIPLSALAIPLALRNRRNSAQHGRRPRVGRQSRYVS